MILEQSSNENAKLEINKLFDDKQIALNLIEFLCKNSVPIKQLNEVLHNLIRINKN